MGECFSMDTAEGGATASKQQSHQPSKEQHRSTSSQNKKAVKLQQQDSLSIHGNLVRERNLDFHEVYDVVELIGEGSISNISKIQLKESAVGGSANPLFVKNSRKRQGSTKQFPATTLTADDRTSSTLSAGSRQYFALKEIDLSFVKKEYVEELRNEVELLKSLDHPNIIKAYETFRIKKRLAIVMEICSGGDLYSRNPYTEAQAARVIRQVLSAVAYLHNRSIVHRDIKYENIMFENKEANARIKLIDFGLARAYLDRELTERVGTLYTMSPEVIRGEYTSKADMWSVGVVAYMLLSGEKPFWSRTRRELVEQITRAQYSLRGQNWAHVSKEGKSFVRSLLTIDEHSRMTAPRALKHHWLSSNTKWSEEKPDLDSWKSAQAQLVQYADSPEFKKLALMVIAKKSTSDEIFELRQMFDALDKDNSGTVTFQEFRKGLSDLNYTDEEIKCMFAKLDLNRNGVIQYTEFLAATLEAQGRIDEYRIAEAFDQLDSDDTGYISKRNLCAVLGKRCLNRACSDDYINKLIDELDEDGDGKISYDEFKKAFAVAVDTNVKTMCKRCDSC